MLQASIKRFAPKVVTKARFHGTPLVCQSRQVSSKPNSASPQAPQQTDQKNSSSQTPADPPKKRKTQTELDEELRQKMAGMSGDGGEAGVEYEDGQPVSMKRSVKNNMFRYI